MKLLLITAFILLGAMCYNANAKVTWDGPLSIDFYDKWEKVTLQSAVPLGLCLILFTNPDVEGDPQTVKEAHFHTPSGWALTLSVEYTYKGKDWRLTYDWIRNHYVSVPPIYKDKEEKKEKRLPKAGEI